MFIKCFSVFTFIIYSSHAEPASPKLKVAVTFSVLKNLVEEIGGDAVEASSIVPVNGDPHTYQPTPNDAKLIAHADLVVVNGLGFEGWIDRLISASGYSGVIVNASRGVSYRLISNPPSQPDPHAWHDVRNAIIYVSNICNALCNLDPSRSKYFRQREHRFSQELTELHQSIRDSFLPLPESSRQVVTTHDAFWYFGEAYGIKFLSPVGVSTDIEPSAAQIAKLIETIKSTNIRAVFLENITSQKMIQQVSDETGIAIKGTLFADSLSSPDGPAPTYIRMMVHNAGQILAGLGT